MPYTLDGGYRERIIPDHSVVNLPVLVKVPGGKIVYAYIFNHLHYWHEVYLSKDDKKYSWNDKNLIH